MPVKICKLSKSKSASLRLSIHPHNLRYRPLGLGLTNWAINMIGGTIAKFSTTNCAKFKLLGQLLLR